MIAFFIVLATAALSTTIPMPDSGNRSGAFFMDCTSNKYNGTQKSSQMWILKDVTRVDFKKAAVAITSASKHLSFEHDYRFGEMQLMFGANPAGPVGAIPNGTFRVEYSKYSPPSYGHVAPAVQPQPFLFVDTELEIQGAPFEFLSSTFQSNALPGQVCNGIAMAEFDIRNLQLNF